MSLIAEPMSENDALRAQVAELRFQNYLASGKSDSVTGVDDQAVATGSPITRAAVAKARLTVVTNKGAKNVTVSEAGHIVAILQPGWTWESPLNGAGSIICECFGGDSSTVAITTYLLP